MIIENFEMSAIELNRLGKAERRERQMQFTPEARAAYEDFQRCLFYEHALPITGTPARISTQHEVASAAVPAAEPTI